MAGQGDRAKNGSGCRTDEEGPGDIDNNIRNISNNGTISKISVLTAMPMLGTERKAWAEAMWQLPFPSPSLLSWLWPSLLSSLLSLSLPLSPWFHTLLFSNWQAMNDGEGTLAPGGARSHEIQCSLPCPGWQGRLPSASPSPPQVRLDTANWCPCRRWAPWGKHTWGPCTRTCTWDPLAVFLGLYY